MLLVDELPVGTVLVSEIELAVSRSRFTIVVLSHAYLADRWAVFGEQLATHASVERLRLVPLRLTDVVLPLRLEARVALDFTTTDRWESESARLRDLLQTTSPAFEQLACPYPGMRPFGEHEASQFFGREREIDDLVGRLDRGEREIYVIGPSGSGKSSLVHAGLLPVLAAGSSRLERSFVVRTMRPGERPTDRLSSLLGGDPASAAAAIDKLVASAPAAKRVLVVVDQLEELFTFTSPQERQQFIAMLRRVATESRCYFVLALRADFYGAFMDSELWPDGGAPSRVDVAPLRGPALAQAITRPALVVGVHLEKRLCDRIVFDAATEPGALPHVQETLRLLWDKRRHRLLGLAEYEELGEGGRGLDVAIARRADATMRALSAAHQVVARRVLLRLVIFGEGRADTRRQQEVRALRSAADDERTFLHVLHRLVEGRLVTVDGAERADGALADLAHEALITAWPAFRDWITGRRIDEQQRRRLETKADEWIERGRGTASLLDRIELAEAVQWMNGEAARDLGYGLDLPALVVASQVEVHKARRQQRWRVFSVVVGLVVVFTLSAVVWKQWPDVQRVDEGRRMLDEGRALLDSHPMQALPYLVAARVHGIESLALRRLFAQVVSATPQVTFTSAGSSIHHAAFGPDGRRVITAGDHGATIWTVATGRPALPMLGHQARVNAATFSPDGTRVVTASADKTARLWNAMTGESATRPLVHDGDVRAAVFSPDAKLVLTASADGQARLWDAATGDPVTKPLVHRAAISGATFSSDGKRVVTASDDSTARVWDARTGRPVTASLEHRGHVHAAAFSPDGTRVITASEDSTARIWDAGTGHLLASLPHRGGVLAAAFSPDGTRVITASADGTAALWESSTGKPVTPSLSHQGAVRAAAFSPDGTRVVTASDDQTARVWDAATGKAVTPPLEHAKPVTDAAFSPDGTRVITAGGDSTARSWAVAASPVIAPLAHQNVVLAAAFSSDGTRVATGSWDTTARIWDAATGSPVSAPLAHQDIVQAVAFSPDGSRLITASFDKTARLWDARTGSPIVALEHRGTVLAAVFSPDGARVVTASADRTARIWDATTGSPTTGSLVHDSVVACASFSADSKRVITASSDGTARIWDAATGSLMTRIQHRQAVDARFSPDGTLVVTASSDGTARVWDAVTGTAVTPPLVHQGVVLTVAFSPDGNRVVTASGDKTARVWDARTGMAVAPAFIHQGPVRAAVFSSDGARVITASDDGTARVWDAATGRPMTSPLAHQAAVVDARFGPDGNHVVTASCDHTARIWDLGTTIGSVLGSVDDWQLVARCSPFMLLNGVITTNPEPLAVCPR